MARTALVITHDDDAARGQRMAGLLTDALSAADYRIEVRSLVAGESFPHLSEVDCIIPIGSEASAYDDSLQWLATELEYLRNADRAGVPVLGICFGAQLLARALGGSVAPGEVPEVGMITVDTVAPDLLPAGPWVSSHYDVIVPPSGARVIARTDLAVQAFVKGPHLALQFHPETTGEVLRAWDGRRRANLPDGDRQLSTWLDLPEVTKTLESTSPQRIGMCRDIVKSFADGRFQQFGQTDLTVSA